MSEEGKVTWSQTEFVEGSGFQNGVGASPRGRKMDLMGREMIDKLLQNIIVDVVISSSFSFFFDFVSVVLSVVL